MDTFYKLNILKEKAQTDNNLREKLLNTKNSSDPMLNFCKIARENGIEIYAGELFAAGLEYMDNTMKSTNGGNPSYYEDFADVYENFLLGL